MSALIETKKINELDTETIVQNIANNGFQILRGMINVDELKLGIKNLKEIVSEENDNPSAGIKPEQIMSNFQKWSIGYTSPKDDNLGRFFRTIYNPLFAEDIYGLHSSFTKLIELRNTLTGMPLDFAKSIEEGNIYSGCRIQHYPCGGGFMQIHTDHVAEANLSSTEQSKYIQLLLIMTEKHKDFEQGGGVVIKDGKKIYPEDTAQIGDVVLYDGLTRHGVQEIDPHKNLDLSITKGRLAGFCTIYKKW